MDHFVCIASVSFPKMDDFDSEAEFSEADEDLEVLAGIARLPSLVETPGRPGSPLRSHPPPTRPPACVHALVVPSVLLQAFSSSKELVVFMVDASYSMQQQCNLEDRVCASSAVQCPR